MMKIAFAAAAAMLPLAFAAPALAQGMPPAAYVKAAGASDLFERDSAMIVLKTTRDPKIKEFASMMIHDHTKSTELVKAAAMQSGMHPAPPMLTPRQTHMLADLRAAHGAARDALYVRQQKAAHDEALGVQEGYANGGTDPALKATAGKIVPVVKHHIMMLGNLG